MGALHSPRWYRVAGLRPRLSADLTVRRQRLRGATWMLLSDAAGGRSVRLNAAAYALVGRLDGQCTLHQAWEAQLARPFDAATQDDTIELLAQLREAGLLRLDQAADFDQLLPHLDRLRRPAGRHSLLAWRLPLGNPQALLQPLDPLARLLFSRPAWWLWCLMVAHGLFQALQHAPTLWAHGQAWLGQPQFVALAALLFVPVKLLHELAHGLAVRRWGGAVPRAGVTLMLGLPMPYVDASAASAFSQRHQRVLVSAAGMMAELALAALALPVWLALDDGPARDAAFVLLVLTSVSTLLFNANPLLRLDGYYIASDLLQLPNLAPRSQAHWRSGLQRRLLRLPGAEPAPLAPGEALWLRLYAPLAWANGLLVAALAVAWLGQVSGLLGLAAAAALGVQMVLRPAAGLLCQLQAQALAHDRSARRWRRLRLGSGLALVLMLALPWPQRSLVQGVVWPADDAQLRADAEGQVEAVLLADGAPVQPGSAVLQLANPTLRAQHQRQAAQLAALEATLYDALPSDGSGAGDARAQLAAAQAALARLDERLAALTVRAQAAGQLALPNAADLPGRHVRQGTLLGQVITAAPPTVRVALPEAEATALRGQTGPATVWLTTTPAQALPAQWLRDAGGAVLRLPSAALSQRHGGQVPTQPGDKDDLTPLQPVLLLDLRLPESTAPRTALATPATPPTPLTPVNPAPTTDQPTPATWSNWTTLTSLSTLSTSADAPAAAPRPRMGERAWVRFDGGWSPLAWHWARGLRRLVLQHFNPQA